MPLFEYKCLACGQSREVLVLNREETPRCDVCGGGDLKKLISAHASASGSSPNRIPGPGDTGCCGSHPGQAHCAGPGTCCGKQI